MNLLWLVIVLISFHNVSADPPALLSVEYTVKAYQSLDAGRQVAVVTGTFDQDVYANASCTSLATKTVYTRCCTDEIQTDCHLSVNPNNQCVDSQTILGGSLARSQGKTFEFHVQNYQSCDSVIFLARALSGDPDVFVSVRLSNTRPTPLAHNYRSEEMGSDAFLRCCSSILQSHPTWNGTVFVTVQSRAYSDASFEVLVHDDPARLSVTDFWWMSPVQVECSARNQTFSTRDCQYSELCMFFSPSDDPLFIYLATVTSRIYYGMGTMIDYNPRQISLGLVTKLVDLRYDPNVKYFPFPIELLSDPDCKVSFPTVMNIQGQRPTNSRPFSPRALSCSLEEFTNVTRGIENVITSLKTSNHTVQAVVDDHMYRAEALTINNAWIGCVEMVQRELLNDRVDLSYINQTRFCYATSSSSAEYLDDPCCNRALRNTMCCAPRDVLAPITRFAMHNDTINGRCNHPSCVRQSLEDFIVLAESTGDIFSGCSKSSFAALTDPIFTTDPWATCATTIYQATCTSNLECQSKLGIENSLCLGIGYCTIPCTSDDTCSTGSCVTVQNQRTCLLYNQNITADRLAAAEPMLTCLHKNLAPFAAAFIRQELNIPISASASEFKEHLGDALTGDTCVGFGSVSDAQRANQSLCLAPNSCNWAQCTDTSATCTQDNCLDSTMDAEYCQACFGTNCREVSSAQMCSYYTVTDEESCLDVNGHFNPLRPKQEQCIAANSTAEACFPPNFCSEEQRANNTCAPLCYVPSIVDEDTCSSTTLGSMALTWTNWTADFVTYGLCVDASINSRAQCYNASNGQATWWPGTQFTYEDLRTKAECESVGYCSPLGHDTYQDICLRTYYCDGCPTCTTQEACVQSGQCNNRVGCYVPFKATGGCDSGTWTPEGCLNSWNQSRCALEGARWVAEVYQDRATCLAAGSACVETVQLRGYWRTGGVTYKNQTECVECNGQWQSVYQFQEGRWRPSQFTQCSWTSRNFTTANRWSRVLNQNLFYAMHRRAAARRYSNILTTNIYCRYSKLISSLTPLACDCGEDRAANEACFASITQSVMSVIQACNNVPTEFNVRLGNVTVDQSFESRSSDCMDIPVSEVPQKQFLQRHLPTLSSVTVSLSQAGKAAQVRFIKNDNGVAVGEIVGDGLNISPPTTDFTGTIKVCLTLANLTGSGDMDIRVLDLATPNEAWNHFTPLGLNLTFTDNVACTEVPQSGLIVFPVGLIADWESAIFIETLHIGEILVIYLGSGLYLLVLAMTLYQMHHHIREHMRTKTKKFFKVGRLGLMILTVVLIDRFLYLMLLPNGILEQSRVADVLFSELPAMFYLCIYSLIVLRWAEICHFTMTLNTGASFNKLMPLVIAVNSVIAVAFVVLLVMFLVQPDNVNDVLSCASNFQLQKTTAEILAIVYRVVFSAFCLTFSILFAVYGGRIMQMIRESNKLALEVGAKDKVRLRNRKITTLITISLACTLCLLAQSACLLWISFNNANRSVIGILVFFYIVELGPAIIFIFLFKSTSIFAKFSRRKGWKKRSTEGGGGGSTSYSYQQLTENNSSK